MGAADLILSLFEVCALPLTPVFSSVSVLFDNQISQIPESLGQLTKLEQLYLHES